MSVKHIADKKNKLQHLVNENLKSELRKYKITLEWVKLFSNKMDT